MPSNFNFESPYFIRKKGKPNPFLVLTYTERLKKVVIARTPHSMRGTWQSHEIASSRRWGIRNDDLPHANVLKSFTIISQTCEKIPTGHSGANTSGLPQEIHRMSGSTKKSRPVVDDHFNRNPTQQV
jgi:hypothetical protein